MSEFKVLQLAVGGFDHNFTYLVYAANGDAAIVDPCGDIELIKKALTCLSGITPRYILVTHWHRDHISGLSEVSGFFVAPVMAHPRNVCHKTVAVQDRERLPFGSGFIETMYTPGHSTDSITWRLSDDSAIFTGDTLFVDWIGYCDAAVMFHTLKQVIMPLADSNVVYSGHDYGREPFSLLGVEKTRNPYLAAADFAAFELALNNL